VPARFILEITVADGREDDLVRAYGALRERLEQGVPGLRGHQLAQNVDDPSRWIITSEWDDIEDSVRWDRSEEHNRLVGPIRACFERAASTKFVIRDGLSG
jgi:heme-degrading monooxygenase HmoA